MLAVFIAFLVILKWWRKDRELYQTNWKVKHSDLIFEDGTFGKIAQLDGDPVTVRSLDKKTVREDKALLAEMKMLRSACHRNVTTFVGVCTDPNHVSVVWEHCPMGRLDDLLMTSQSKMDAVRQLSVALDISNGLLYLHTSEIGNHGNLRASSVVLDRHWVAKITDFGLTTLQRKEKRKVSGSRTIERSEVTKSPIKRFGWRMFTMSGGEKKEKMKKMKKGDETQAEIKVKDEDCGNLYWTSPERLRCRLSGVKDTSTRESDVYSLAVVLKQIICTNSPYEGRQNTMTPKDIVTKVAYPDVESPLMRPHIPEEVGCQSVAMATFTQLIQACWSESVCRRPSMRRIVRKLKRIALTKEKDLWTMVCDVKKLYSTKIAPLIRKMETVQNEIPSIIGSMKLAPFHQVRHATVCFWSVANFTNFVIQRSPADALQILKDIEGLIQNVTDNFNVSKVSTVCNSSMLISGSSAHSADHAPIMADASLVLLESIYNLNAQQRPYYHDFLDIRIGLNSGPVVVGVVGKAIPRLCVFGRTVRSALQCERDSFAKRIHISTSAYNNLQTAGTFLMELRNPLDAKSIDDKPTYWLYGKAQETQESQL